MKAPRDVFAPAVALLLMLLAVPGHGQTPPPPTEQSQPGSEGPAEPTASHDGKAELRPPRPVAEGEDPLNQLVGRQTVDGVVLSITIDEATVTLDAIAPARVPRRTARANRDPGGDRVTVTGLVNGETVATTVVPDNVLNASEGEGLVRTPRRQIAVALATDRPLDEIRVEAPATGAKATLDARPAYARICAADPNNKLCARR